uniref:Uncharacterized protein n=1 Tax=Anguilla anguilla TaxID=7936 RepID=A0A0E9TMX4_ANGAN
MEGTSAQSSQTRLKLHKQRDRGARPKHSAVKYTCRPPAPRPLHPVKRYVIFPSSQL